jgi:hypothetical protein
MSRKLESLRIGDKVTVNVDTLKDYGRSVPKGTVGIILGFPYKVVTTDRTDVDEDGIVRDRFVHARSECNKYDIRANLNQLSYGE